MKFQANTRRRALEYEKDWVAKWKEQKTFEKSVEQRSADDAYVFYDGPPFITGVPHHGTLLSSIVKDAVPRYWTMKGKRVERVWGWDCHGLPAENFVEKQLNITDRRQIVTNASDAAPLDKDGNELPTITLETYITKARESMVANSETWEGVIDRVGRWVDFKGAYRTMDKDFMESVWWAFKELYDAGKIYEGEKVLMYDTRFATPVSKAEVTMDNDAYQTVTDPSVYVKFKLNDSAGDTFVLAWSTTPWTLPANLMLAVSPELTYCEIKTPPVSKRVFLMSGKHAIASEKYFPLLRQRLENDGYEVAIIDHVNPSNPRLDENLQLLEGYDFTNAHIIAHSLGAATFLKYLDDHDVRIGSLSMIAPSYPGGDFGASNKEWKKTSGYAGFEVDFDSIRKKIDRRPSIIYSDDLEARNEGFVELGEKIYAEMIYEPNKGHFFEKEQTMAPDYAFEFSERLIIAKEALERTLKDDKNQPLAYEVVREFPGSELVGKSYEPLATGSTWPQEEPAKSKIHKIYAADFVSHESGSGIVHIAPAYGEDDFELAKAHGVEAFHVIDDNGYYFDTDYNGLEVWENNKFIAKDLKEKGIAWKIEYIRHEYPFNPRSKQRIMYRAIPSWFFDVENSKPLMLEQNENINWFPDHLKHGRFEKNIEQAPDWNLSRDRFWATAMPVWKGDRGTVKVVGSYAELKELSGQELDDYHRPWIDDVTFEIDGETFTRIDKVLDGWFESASMPFAQLHYPFQNQEKFEKNYPADFIVEYVGQVRAWFYYVHLVNTTLADIGAFGADSQKPEKNAFKNVITTGTLAGNDGRKMSKSLGNFTDPNELMDKYSADSLRFLLLMSPVLKGEDFSLQDKDVGDVARKLSMVWNMYDFFTMYAEVDGWEFDPEKPFTLNPDDLANPLDKWIVSRLHQLNQHITEHMDAYDLPSAMEPILPFLDDASNWFVRRSRRRFWKGEDDGDKNDAYRTLHYVLLKLSVLLAPFTPFLAEELYQKMGGGNESVHLLNWPANTTVDQAVLDEMAEVREFINEGLSLRARSGLKVRQPLASVTVPRLGEAVDYKAILLDELNVKLVKVQADAEVAIDETITPELHREGLMREVIRHVQSARKNAGLNVDDRIKLSLATTSEELEKALGEHAQTIAAETLAEGNLQPNTSQPIEGGYIEKVQIEGVELEISLSKV